MIVRYVDAEPNGLASMVGGLIEANLERDPGRRVLLKPAMIGIDAPDAEVAVTLRLMPEQVALANGLAWGRLHLLVRASSDALLELSNVPLRFGLPDPLTAEGRAVVQRLLAGDIRVRGIWRHPVKLSRLTALLSVT